MPCPGSGRCKWKGGGGLPGVFIIDRYALDPRLLRHEHLVEPANGRVHPTLDAAAERNPSRRP